VATSVIIILWDIIYSKMIIKYDTNFGILWTHQMDLFGFK